MRTHEHFVECLKESEPARWKIARWLSSRGHVIQFPPHKVRPQYSKDDGDLMMVMRAEAKQIQKNFTCKEDWPLRRFIVNAKLSHDRADPKPIYYFIMNKAGTHVATVNVKKTFDQWFVDTVNNKKIHNTREFYFCPVELVTFEPMAPQA